MYTKLTIGEQNVYYKAMETAAGITCEMDKHDDQPKAPTQPQVYTH